MALRLLFRCAAWLLLGAVAFVTLSPIELRPVTAATPDLERIAAFAAVGGAFCLGYPKLRFRVLFLVIVAVALLEAMQNLVPGRHGQLQDGAMKASGALCGAALALLIDRRKQTS